MTAPLQSRQAAQVAGLAATFCLLLNVAFYFLSDVYFQDRAARFGPHELAGLGGARMAFAIFTVAVGVGVAAAAFAPRLVGHGIAVISGLLALIAAYFAFAQNLPTVLGLTLLLLGVLFPLLVWRSLAGSRIAWSFLIALCALDSVNLLFGAPKVRGLTELGLWYTLIIPGLSAVGVAALWMLRDQYREPDAKPAAAAAPRARAAVAPMDPAEKERRRKAGVGTMAVGFFMVLIGGVLMVVPTGLGMAGLFLDAGLALAGLIAIVRGYLYIPRS